jgi:hypothetical protein
MSMLELRRVSKVYGAGPTEVQALRGVDLSVEAGAMVAVMGGSERLGQEHHTRDRHHLCRGFRGGWPMWPTVLPGRVRQG